MNEYEDTGEGLKVNEEGHQVWPGFDWAHPDAETAEAMREALTGYQEDDGTWVEIIDDTPQIDALFEYVAEAQHRFDIDEADYSAKDMAAMFEARCTVYDEGYYEVGRDYLREYYDGVHKDPIVGMTEEDIKQVGANLAGSEHEERRYLWVEAEDGRVFCIVRPDYADAQGART